MSSMPGTSEGRTSTRSARSARPSLAPRASQDVGDSEFDILLEELRRLPGCERTKASVIKLLTSHAGGRMYISHKSTLKQVQLAEARHLVRIGLTRAEAARRLAERFVFSPSTAYRRINQAIG